jgi:hypothetical protein
VPLFNSPVASDKKAKANPKFNPTYALKGEE